MQLSTKPPKGTSDWFPEEYKVRKHIFDTWRNVCQSYGFEEYLWPLVESVDIWKAKSWEDVGGSELTQITNREGKLDWLAIRPEMTPTVTRMVASKWKEIEKPVKWFSIANFYRNEKPQKGRNREFWQLNADIFGDESENSDIEILTLSLELMRAFIPPCSSYKLKLNHRGLIDSFLTEVLAIKKSETKIDLMRLLDKYDKLPKEVFEKELKNIGIKTPEPIHAFMNAKTTEDIRKEFLLLAGTESLKQFASITQKLTDLWYENEIEFSGSLIRGFDYYDGIIFEMFDQSPDNPRALFWGGRYNGLADIFWVKEGIPAVGFAPGDETMKLFLEWHGLLDEIQNQKSETTFIPLLDEAYFVDIQNIATKLRSEWKRVVVGLSSRKLGKALQYAKKKGYNEIVVYGEEEKNQELYTVENLETGQQERIKI